MKSEETAGAPAIVVTGVSSGIGHGIAHVLVHNGFRVFGSVRRHEDAQRLSRELGGAFTPLLFDVTDAAAVEKGAAQVRDALNGGRLAGLVNNAGIAVPGPLLELTGDDLRKQIEVNLLSVMTVTRAFFPLLRLSADGGADGSPRIVNISSVAGRLALPFLGGYAAAKHGLEGLSDSLRRELMLFGIDVVLIDPGTVATAIWEKADALDLSPFEKSPYRKAMLGFRDAMVSSGRRGSPPERVGVLVLRALRTKRPRARYALGGGSAAAALMSRLLPTRVFDRMIAGRLGLLSGRRAGTA
ncbi:MAG: SDR family oxidoreductase [Spirochaetia bacterium]|jgi:NAD(P)-dependent dehydrogenase (short-subunit alcohol dehydrogenase family)